MELIKGKSDIAPSRSALDYRAGWENSEVDAEDEIMILNKLADEGIIDVVNNYSLEY